MWPLDRPTSTARFDRARSGMVWPVVVVLTVALIALLAVTSLWCPGPSLSMRRSVRPPGGSPGGIPGWRPVMSVVTPSADAPVLVCVAALVSGVFALSTGYAFPSGHTTYSALTAGVVIVLARPVGRP
jgi:membrane-associated phospholipid phosphatase